MESRYLDSPVHRRVRPAFVVLGLVLLGGCAAPPAVRWSSPTLANCQKKVDKVTGKLDRKLRVALAKCKKLYRAHLTPGGTLPASAVNACTNVMQKAFLYPDPTGMSAVAKAKSQLDALAVNLDCSDADLLALGHAPAGPMSDMWSRLMVMQRIKSAYEDEAQAASDLPDIFELYAASGCGACPPFAQPPCRRATCTLAATSSLDGGNSTPLQGALSFEVCQSAGLFGGDVGVFGVPTSEALAADAGDSVGMVGAGVQYACIRMLGAEGVVQGAGSTLPGAAIVDVCQDHMVNTPDSNECLPATCSDDSTDAQHAGVTNGGVCTSIGVGGPIFGGALVIGRFELTLVGTGLGPYADTRGADGLPCTHDDVAVPVPATYSVVLGNGLGVSGTVRDANAVDGNMVADSIALPPLFDTNAVYQGSLSGGSLNGFVPALHAFEVSPGTPPDADALTAVRINCQ